MIAAPRQIKIDSETVFVPSLTRISSSDLNGHSDFPPPASSLSCQSLQPDVSSEDREVSNDRNPGAIGGSRIGGAHGIAAGSGDARRRDQVRQGARRRQRG